jgi:putative ABC transport system permease protein
MHEWRITIRQLGRQPVFSAVVVLTLALGIGTSTLIFSIIDSVLLRPLAFPGSDRIVRVFEAGERGNRINPSDPNFADLKARSRVFEAFAQFGDTVDSVAGGSEPVRARVTIVSREFGAVLGVQPLLGRPFAPEELRQGATPVALISYSYWQRYLGGTADFAARSLRIGERSYSIVGVMPRGFDYPNGSDVWTPREQWPVLPSRTAHNLRAIGRLAPGVSVARAREELGAIARALEAEYGDDTWMQDVAVVPLRDYLVGDVRPALLVLAGAVALLFVIACANVVSMLLARSVARQRELAIRVALGAGRLRLARQFFAEALVLCGAGGVVGALAAGWGLALVVALQAGTLPRAAGVRIDWTAMAFTAGLSLLAAGILSAFLAWRTPGEGIALHANRHSGAAGRGSLRGGIVAEQVAMAAVLLVGAVLLGRGFLALTGVDPGFRTDHVMLMNLETLSTDPARTGYAEFRIASRGYFEAMGIPLLRGRLFERGDGPEATPVAVVSQSFADLKWPNGDALGKLVEFGNMDGDLTPFTIVGVVGDVRDYGLNVAPRPTLYGDFRQRPRRYASFWIAMQGPKPQALVPEARRIVQRLNPDLPPEFHSAAELYSTSLARRRFNLIMLASLGAAALLLALAGVYGAVSFNVAQRTKEIGVRVALGAQRSNVVSMVLRRTLVVAGIGVALGLGASLVAAKFIASLLYGVPSHDATAYTLTAAGLLCTAAATSWLPALRAARVDPVVALRDE